MPHAGSFRNLWMLHRNLPEHNLDGAPNLQKPDVDIAPELSGSFSGTTPGSRASLGWRPRTKPSFAVGELSAYAIKNIGTLWNFTKHLHQNPPEPLKVSAPGTSPAVCTGALWNLTRYLRQNPPEPCKRNLLEPLKVSARNLPEPHHSSSPEPLGTQVSAPETSETSPGIRTKTLQNPTKSLHRKLLERTCNPPEPHELSAPEPSGTSPAVCTGALRNLTRYLHRKSPEPCPEPGVEAAPDRTGANLS